MVVHLLHCTSPSWWVTVVAKYWWINRTTSITTCNKYRTIYLSAKLDCYQNCQYKCLHAAVYLYCNIYRVIKTDCGKSRIHYFVNDDWIQLGYWIKLDFLLVSNFPLFKSSYSNLETFSSTIFNQLQLICEYKQNIWT